MSESHLWDNQVNTGVKYKYVYKADLQRTCLENALKYAGTTPVPPLGEHNPSQTPPSSVLRASFQGLRPLTLSTPQFFSQLPHWVYM